MKQDLSRKKQIKGNGVPCGERKRWSLRWCKEEEEEEESRGKEKHGIAVCVGRWDAPSLSLSKGEKLYCMEEDSPLTLFPAMPIEWKKCLLRPAMVVFTF